MAWSLTIAAPPPARGQEQADAGRLVRLLAKAKAYCARLETAALDFVCLEKIEEKFYFVTELHPELAVPAVPGSGRDEMPREYYSVRTRVYDYQYVRLADRKVERRTLVEKDGRKMKTDDAPLDTETIRVENALFGPIGLVGADWQPGHTYRIAGEETVDGHPTVIVEAVPRSSLDRPHCYGLLWIREDDGSIVKISWDQASVGNFKRMKAEAEKLGAEPRLTSVTEYGQERSGLRFPSRDTTEEAYIKDGRKLVQSLTKIIYRDYKFFTVETQVVY